MSERRRLGRLTDAPDAEREPMAMLEPRRARMNWGVWAGSIAMSASAKAMIGRRRRRHACPHGAAFAMVLRQPDVLHVGERGEEGAGHRGRVVGAAVVHHDELGGLEVDGAALNGDEEPGHAVLEPQSLRCRPG